MFKDATNLALNKCKLSMILDNGQELAYDYFHGRFITQLPSVSAKSARLDRDNSTGSATQPCWLICFFCFFSQLNWKNI